MRIATCRNSASFDLAFATARAAGCGGFWWNNSLFNTRRADDPPDLPEPVILEIEEIDERVEL